MQEALMTTPKLKGVAVTVVTDGQLEHAGWLPPLHEALLAAGADSVEVQGWAHAVSRATFEALEKGAERVARTLRRMVQPEEGAEMEPVAPPSRRLLLFDNAEALQRHERLDLTGAPVVRVGLVWSRQGVERWRRAGAQGFLLADAAMRGLLDRPDLPETNVHVCGPVLPADVLQPGSVAPLASLGLGEGARVVLIDATAVTAPQFAQVLEGCAGGVTHGAGLYVWDADRPETVAMVRDVATRMGVQIQRFGAYPVFQALLPHAEAVLIPAKSRVWPQLDLLQRPTLWLWPDTTWRPATLRPNEAAAFGAGQVRDGLRLLSAASGEVSGVSSNGQVRFSPHRTISALQDILAHAGAVHFVNASPGIPLSAPAPRPTASPGPFEVVGVPVATASPPPFAPTLPTDPRRALTELILEERRLQAELETLVQDRDRWMRREVLAAERGESHLREIAAERMRAAQERLDGVQGGLARNRQAQADVKRSARGGGGAKAWTGGPVVPDDEARFRELELSEKPTPEAPAGPEDTPSEGPKGGTPG